MLYIGEQARGLITSRQRINAQIIEHLFRWHGFHDVIIAAAIVNAMAESSLDHLAEGDNGRSLGLFQLSEHGAGHGMSREDRLNPYTNTLTIIEEINSYRGNRLRSSAIGLRPETEVVAEVAGIFSDDIERPGNRERARERRAEIARWMFPNDILVPLHRASLEAREKAPELPELPRQPSLLERLSTPQSVLLAATVTAVSIAVARVWWVSRRPK